MEIGPGIGNLTRHFLEHAEMVEGVEPNPMCAELLLKAFGKNEKFSLRQNKVEDRDFSALASKGFDTIICVNVLEHIEDDLDALNQFKQILIPGGILVLFVPSISWAYGPIDAALGHFRRYHRKHLGELLQKTGFQLVSSRYSNLIGLLGWVFSAKVRKALKQNDTQIKIFDSLSPILKKAESLVPPPIGLLIVAVGRKQNGT